MKGGFCINCGTNRPSPAVCPTCGLDPQVLQESMIRHLAVISESSQGLSVSRLNLRHPGEQAALFLSASTLLLATCVLGFATLGLFAVGVVAALLQLRSAEAAERLELKRVTPTAEPLLWNLAIHAAFRLDVEPPPVYIKYSSTINAYTSGLWGSHYVVLHSELVRLYSPSEILFVLGHEFGHAKLEHVSWMVVTNGSMLRVPFVREILGLFFRSWTKIAERSADRAGLMAVRDPQAAARALVKLSQGDLSVTVEEFLAAADEQENQATTRLSEWTSSHPRLWTRIRDVQQFATLCRKQGLLN